MMPKIIRRNSTIFELPIIISHILLSTKNFQELTKWNILEYLSEKSKISNFSYLILDYAPLFSHLITHFSLPNSPPATQNILKSLLKLGLNISKLKDGSYKVIDGLISKFALSPNVNISLRIMGVILYTEFAVKINIGVIYKKCKGLLLKLFGSNSKSEGNITLQVCLFEQIIILAKNNDAEFMAEFVPIIQDYFKEYNGDINSQILAHSAFIALTDLLYTEALDYKMTYHIFHTKYTHFIQEIQGFVSKNSVEMTNNEELLAIAYIKYLGASSLILDEIRDLEEDFTEAETEEEKFEATKGIGELREFLAKICQYLVGVLNIRCSENIFLTVCTSLTSLISFYYKQAIQLLINEEKVKNLDLQTKKIYVQEHFSAQKEKLISPIVKKLFEEIISTIGYERSAEIIGKILEAELEIFEIGGYNKKNFVLNSHQIVLKTLIVEKSPMEKCDNLWGYLSNREYFLSDNRFYYFLRALISVKEIQKFKIPIEIGEIIKGKIIQEIRAESTENKKILLTFINKYIQNSNCIFALNYWLIEAKYINSFYLQGKEPTVLLKYSFENILEIGLEIISYYDIYTQEFTNLASHFFEEYFTQNELSLSEIKLILQTISEYMDKLNNNIKILKDSKINKRSHDFSINLLILLDKQILAQTKKRTPITWEHSTKSKGKTNIYSIDPIFLYCCFSFYRVWKAIK